MRPDDSASSFIFTLDEFARELLFLLDSMGEITDQEKLLNAQRSFLGWKWIWSVLTRRRARARATANGGPRERRTLRRRMCEFDRFFFRLPPSKNSFQRPN